MFELLDARGFKVLLVNARHAKNVSGRKFDVVGETGQKILRALVGGERDGNVLTAMKNVCIRARHDEIAKSLQGSEKLLFALKQALALFGFYANQPAE